MAARPRPRGAVRRHPLPRGPRPRLLHDLRAQARDRVRADDDRDRHPQLDQLGAGGQRDRVPGARRLRRRLHRAPLRRALRRADQPQRLHARLDARPRAGGCPSATSCSSTRARSAVEGLEPAPPGRRTPGPRPRSSSSAGSSRARACGCSATRSTCSPRTPSRSSSRVTFLGKQSSVDGLEAGEYLAARARGLAVGGRGDRRPRPARGGRLPALARPAAHRDSLARRQLAEHGLRGARASDPVHRLAGRRHGGVDRPARPRGRDLRPAGRTADGPVRAAHALADRLRRRCESEQPEGAASRGRGGHLPRRARALARRCDPGVEAAARAPRASALSVCLLGSDSKRVAASKGSLGSRRRARRPRCSLPRKRPTARTAGELVLFMPAGSRLADGAIEALERAAAFSGAEVIAVAVRHRDAGRRHSGPGGRPCRSAACFDAASVTPRS